jgi:hypothetical protein
LGSVSSNSPAIFLASSRQLPAHFGDAGADLLIKIGAKVVTHGRYVAFQMAEVAIPRNLFGDILRLIAELRPPPDPAPA